MNERIYIINIISCYLFLILKLTFNQVINNQTIINKEDFFEKL